MERYRCRLSAARMLPLDIVRIARSIPSSRVESTFRLADVAALRGQCRPRVSWLPLFLKAFALTAREQPWLRQTFCRWPLPHLYQHPHSIGMVPVARTHQGEPWLCWGRFLNPASVSLSELQDTLVTYLENPVETRFRRQVRFQQMPSPVRRLGWWILLNTSGRLRERKLGTFSISTLAGQGVINRDHPSILTTSLSYGPVDEGGQCLVTLIYDHRVFDGMQAAQTLRRLEDVLCGPVAKELHGLLPGRRAA